MLEETGFVCETGDELATVTYVDHRGRPKVVRYWAMQVVDGRFVANDEVDHLEWLGVERAARRLSHERDRDLLREWDPPAT